MHYVISDLHGNGMLWNKIKEKLNKDDILYFLGDAIDRGPDGVSIMLDLLNDTRVIYLKGNHEDFVEKFLYHAIKTEWLDDVPSNIRSLWLSNGGSKTMNDIWGDMSTEEMEKLYFKLKSLPQRVEVTVNNTKFLLSHAGYTPRYLARDLSDDRDVLLWNREHFTDSWSSADGDNVAVIHGHTPTGFLRIMHDDCVYFNSRAYISDEATKAFEPVVYAAGHKVDLDLCSFISNRAALYCLETKTWEIIDINID